MWSNAIATCLLLPILEDWHGCLQHLNQVGVAIMHGFKVQNGSSVASVSVLSSSTIITSYRCSIHLSLKLSSDPHFVYPITCRVMGYIAAFGKDVNRPPLAFVLSE